MSYVTNIRGDLGAPIVADYRCEEHGVFELIVSRPAPDDQPCPDCGAASPWIASSVRIKHPTFVSAHRGQSDEKPHPWVLDTEPLADGKVTHAEFQKQRQEMWAAHDADNDPDRPRKVYSR